jgi:uncharacterized protein (DUF427 family)
MTTKTATLNGTIIATSSAYKTIEGNIYFPPEDVSKEYFKTTETHSSCPWKGKASYYTIEVDGKVLKDAAWYYPDPLEGAKAKGIENYVAFCELFLFLEAR